MSGGKSKYMTGRDRRNENRTENLFHKRGKEEETRERKGIGRSLREGGVEKRGKGKKTKNPLISRRKKKRVV